VLEKVLWGDANSSNLETIFVFRNQTDSRHLEVEDDAAQICERALRILLQLKRQNLLIEATMCCFIT
jgi:hypothetical protein